MFLRDPQTRLQNLFLFMFVYAVQCTASSTEALLVESTNSRYYPHSRSSARILIFFCGLMKSGQVYLLIKVLIN